MLAGWPTLADDGRLLVVRLGGPHRALSSAMTGGGFVHTEAVVWRYVHLGELGPEVDADRLLGDALAAAGLDGAVGMLTARQLASFDCVTESGDGESVRAVATVGLGNALAAGDAPGPLRPGTINLLVQLSRPLADGALVEALALAAEARTAAVLEARVPSRRSARLATGTGTDCIVVAAPVAAAASPNAGERWAGKHTRLGALIGAAVYEVVARGSERWIAEDAARMRKVAP